VPGYIATQDVDDEGGLTPLHVRHAMEKHTTKQHTFGAYKRIELRTTLPIIPYLTFWGLISFNL
jgi:hypothetical protein